MQLSIHVVKREIDIHDVEMKKQLAAVEEYKLSVVELGSWFAKAESDDDASLNKPCAKEDIEEQLRNIKVRIKINMNPLRS